jgi:hypothetical protein
MSVPPPSPAPTERRGFEWWSPFAALLTAYGVAIVFTAILAGATGHTEGSLPAGITLVATFVQDALLVAAMIGFAAVAGARLLPATFGLRRIPRARIWTTVKVAGGVFLAFYVFLIAWAQLQPEAKDDLLDDLGAKTSVVAAVGVALLVCVVAPIVEELFFRGFLFPSLQRVMPWIPAAVVGGIVFGGVHAGGTPAIFLVPLAVLGGLLCVLYRRTGSLLPGMGVHAFNNALTLGVGLGWSAAGVVAVLIAAPLVVLAIVVPLSE